MHLEYAINNVAPLKMGQDRYIGAPWTTLSGAKASLHRSKALQNKNDHLCRYNFSFFLNNNIYTRKKVLFQVRWCL